MNIGFTGTRNGMTEDQWNWTRLLIRQHLDPGENSLHHGCCIGADVQAHNIGRSIKEDGFTHFGIVAHPPFINKYRAHIDDMDVEMPTRDYLQRNRNIVNSCNLLIACPSGDEVQGSGTWWTIRYALSRKVALTIIMPDGTITKRNHGRNT